MCRRVKQSISLCLFLGNLKEKGTVFQFKDFPSEMHSLIDYVNLSENVFIVACINIFAFIHFNSERE